MISPSAEASDMALSRGSRETGAMITSLHQEQFSHVFVRAVVATAGCSISVPQPDRKSVDFTISSEEHRCPKVDVQVKSTKNFKLEGETFSYPLKINNYNDLIADVSTPRILVLVTLPDTPQEWLSLSEDNLLLKYCAYWTSLKGEPPKDVKESVTIHINRSAVFDVTNLRDLLQKISDGVDP